MTYPDFTYMREEDAHEADIEQLNKQAFGPARFTRAAFFVREGGGHDQALSFVGCFEGQIVGSVRQSRIVVGRSHALLLGPLVVGANHKNVGLGAGLMNQALAAARSNNYQLVLLVGDAPYYARFGFIVADACQIIMPAPVDPRRLLACELVEHALKNIRGSVRHHNCIR